MSKHPTKPDQVQPTYKVGYGKPPAEHRFKPGHRGFGRRRKKPLDLDEMLAKAFSRTMSCNLDGRQQTMSILEVMLNRFAQQVAKDPAKFLKPNLPLIQAALAGQEPASGTGANGVDFTAEFRSKIERMAENLRRLQSGDEETQAPQPKTED